MQYNLTATVSDLPPGTQATFGINSETLTAIADANGKATVVREGAGPGTWVVEATAAGCSLATKTLEL